MILLLSMKKIDCWLVLDNIRSTHNVGSILRTCDGFGIDTVICIGSTPYPIQDQDKRLPHIAQRAQRQIAKTSLGAEKTVSCLNMSTNEFLEICNQKHREIFCIEQSDKSLSIKDLNYHGPCALVVGNEVLGVGEELLNSSNAIFEIPMFGKKESLNVSVASAIAIYQICS